MLDILMKIKLNYYCDVGLNYDQFANFNIEICFELKLNR